MIRSEKKIKDFVWIDIIDPNEDDLRKTADEYAIPLDHALACMEPELLPKYEIMGGYQFIVLRAFDSSAAPELDTIRGITRKLVIFFRENFVLTVHRKEQDYIKNVFHSETLFRHTEDLAHVVVAELMLQVARTYEPEIKTAVLQLDKIEEDVFQQTHSIQMKDTYILKHRISIVKKMLMFMLAPISEASHSLKRHKGGVFHDVNDFIQRLTFQLDDVQENLMSILNLQVSLDSRKIQESANKTNEVMRVLTIFSVFFMPLNLIAGIYGMNFHNMPELSWPYGYSFALSLMLLVSGIVFVCFYRLGWLGFKGKRRR